MRKTLLSILTFAMFQISYGQSISLTQFATGFNSPIGAFFRPGNNTMYVVQQRGRIRMVNNTGTIATNDFLNITSKVSQSGNERGLLSMVFDPDYETNGFFYVNYTKSSDGTTVIARYSRSTTDPNVADPLSEVIVLEIPQPYSNHNGGQLQFDRNGYLMIGMGDGGSANDPQGNGQNPLSFLGKMLRIDVRSGLPYTIPASNPFFGSSTTYPEIWSLGMRNPWRFSYDMVTKDLWIADVGQNVYEEIDFEPAGDPGGKNYGWRCYEGDNVFNSSGCGAASNYTFPVFTYSHTGGNCSVSGGFVYRGGTFGNLYGKYIFADYCSGKIWATEQTTPGTFNTVVLTQTTPVLTNSIVSFAQDNDGEMYVIARDTYNAIYKLSEDGCLPSADIYTDGNINTICNGQSLTLIAPYSADNFYSWNWSGGVIIGNTNTIIVSDSGTYSVTVTNGQGCSATSADFVVNVYNLPTISFGTTPAEVCLNDIVNLTATPSGGQFSGPGVSGAAFNPAIAGQGVHTLKYTYTENGCTGETTVQITVNNCYTSAEQLSKTNITISPNPSKAENGFYIHTNGLPIDQFSIVDLSGKTIYNSGKLNSVTQNIQVQPGKIAAGVYILKLWSDAQLLTRKLVIE
jgi:glucose/arabinose dehydrogenase